MKKELKEKKENRGRLIKNKQINNRKTNIKKRSANEK